ncbi:MAG: hypothetical protein QM723_40420 [Myxococcaceae bacterium]
MNTILITMAVLGAVPTSDFELSAGNGAGRLAQTVNGADIGSLDLNLELAARFRYQVFSVGALAHADAAVNGPYGASLGVTAGVAFRLEGGWQLELLGAAGEHVITQLGSDRFFSTGPRGFDANLPFVGVRAGAEKIFNPESRNHFTLGLTLFADTDVGSAGGTVTDDHCGFLGGCTPGATSQEVKARTSRVGGLITIGWTHDLGG